MKKKTLRKLHTDFWSKCLRNLVFWVLNSAFSNSILGIITTFYFENPKSPRVLEKFVFILVVTSLKFVFSNTRFRKHITRLRGFDFNSMTSHIVGDWYLWYDMMWYEVMWCDVIDGFVLSLFFLFRYYVKIHFITFFYLRISGEKKIGAIKSERGVGHTRQIAREFEEKEDALQGLKVSTFVLFINHLFTRRISCISI